MTWKSMNVLFWRYWIWRFEFVEWIRVSIKIIYLCLIFMYPAPMPNPKLWLCEFNAHIMMSVSGCLVIWCFMVMFLVFIAASSIQKMLFEWLIVLCYIPLLEDGFRNPLGLLWDRSGPILHLSFDLHNFPLRWAGGLQWDLESQGFSISSDSVAVILEMFRHFLLLTQCIVAQVNNHRSLCVRLGEVFICKFLTV